MTEINFGGDKMATERTVVITKKPALSSRRLVPTSSVQILANYRAELGAIERKLEEGSIGTGTKLRRVNTRRWQLKEQLIPRVEARLGII